MVVSHPKVVMQTLGIFMCGCVFLDMALPDENLINPLENSFIRFVSGKASISLEYYSYTSTIWQQILLSLFYLMGRDTDQDIWPWLDCSFKARNG